MEEKCELVLWKADQAKIPLHYRTIINDENNDTLIVYFHGAISGAAKNPRLFPYYNGTKISREIAGANFLLFSDPVLSLGEDVLLTWYCSPYDEEMISKKIAEIISSKIKKYNIKKTCLLFYLELSN